MKNEFTIDAELMRKALGTSMRNPELQRIFKEAAQAAKPVLKLKFAAMVFPDQISDEAFGANLAELTRTLGADDIRYLIDTETDAWLNASRNVGTVDVEGSKSKPSDKNEGCQQETEVESPPKTSGGQVPESAILPNKTIMLWSVVGAGVLIVVIAVFCLCRDDNRWTAEDERNYRESQRMEMHRWYQKMIMKSRL